MTFLWIGIWIVVAGFGFSIFLFLHKGSKGCKPGKLGKDDGDCIGTRHMSQHAKVYLPPEEKDPCDPCPPCYCMQQQDGEWSVDVPPPDVVVDAICDTRDPKLIAKCLTEFLDKIDEVEGDGWSLTIHYNGKVTVASDRGIRDRHTSFLVEEYFSDNP